jgi:hypothetical protein
MSLPLRDARQRNKKLAIQASSEHREKSGPIAQRPGKRNIVKLVAGSLGFGLQ